MEMALVKPVVAFAIGAVLLYRSLIAYQSKTMNLFLFGGAGSEVPILLELAGMAIGSTTMFAAALYALVEILK